METQIVAFINGARYLGSKLIQMSRKEQWGWARGVCSLLVFSDWVISLLYERVKGSVHGVCLLCSPESLVFSSFVEAHTFTLCTHIGTILKQYWVGTWVYSDSCFYEE